MHDPPNLHVIPGLFAQKGRGYQYPDPREVPAVAGFANAGLVAPAVLSRRLKDDNPLVPEVLRHEAADVGVDASTPTFAVE